MTDFTKKVTAFKARTNFGQILDDVRYRKTPYIVERNGREVAAILDIEEYKRLEKWLIEEQFIEEYTAERIRDFKEADKIDTGTKKAITKQLI
jgi:prevent-host-death family protein